jgi:hypothetical protein
VVRKLMLPDARLSYRAPLSPKIMAAMLLVPLLGGGIAFVFSAINGGPWAFVLVWLGVMGGVSYGLLGVSCHEVSIEDGMFRWRTAFRHGVVPMEGLVRVNAWPGGTIHVFEFRDGTRVRVGVMQGYARFLERLSEAYPSLPVPGATYAVFVDHMRVGHGDDGDDRPHSS